MTVPADKTYPAIATNAAWQKKKSFVDKAKSSTKTGLGAALTDAETKWKAIAWANLDPAREKADDLVQAKQHWEAAEAAEQKVAAAKNAVLLAKKQAQAAATNKYLSKPAQTAAAAIADALQKAQARLDQVDITGFEKLRKYVEVSSKVPAVMKAGASIKRGSEQIFYGWGYYYHESKSIKINSGEGWRVSGGGQVGRVYSVDIGITPEANVDGMKVEVSEEALKAAGIGQKFTLQMQFKKEGRDSWEFQAS
jgi:hypothetical protein